MHDIHKKAIISPLSDIEVSKKGSLFSIGANSVIDSFVKIKPVGGAGDIHVGERTVINSGCVLYSGNGISIGSDVQIAANCTIAPVNHQVKDPNMKINEQGHAISKGGIIIEDDVWIGANVVLLDGAIIGKGTVIAAGSLVRGKCEAYKIYGGNPLKMIGKR